MGALVTLDAIAHKKHVVMMNVECDVTIGPMLRRLAEQAGVVYSLAAGDEPAAILELYPVRHGARLSRRRGGQGQEQPARHLRHPGLARGQGAPRAT